MHYITIALSFNSGQVLLFLIYTFLFWQKKKPFHTKSEMNKPQADVNSHLYSLTQENKKSKTLQQKK